MLKIETGMSQGFWRPNPFDVSGRLMGALTRALTSLQAEAVDIALRRGFRVAQDAPLMAWHEHLCRQDGQHILGLAMTLSGLLRDPRLNQSVVGAGYEILAGGILSSARAAPKGGSTTWRMVYPLICDQSAPCIMEACDDTGIIHQSTMVVGKPIIFDDRQDHWTNNTSDRPVIVATIDLVAAELRPRERP